MKKLSKSDANKNITTNEMQLNKDDFIVSKTDTKGNIIYCNEIFAKMAGYPASSLIGANHNLIRHPHMPKLAFKMAWDLIKNKKEFFGFIQNLTIDGGYYWVFAYITADLDASSKIISYTSVRRKAPQSAIDQILPLYKLLLDAENRGGTESSAKVLEEFLEKHNTSYDELIINLQKGVQL